MYLLKEIDEIHRAWFNVINFSNLTVQCVTIQIAMYTRPILSYLNTMFIACKSLMQTWSPWPPQPLLQPMEDHGAARRYPPPFYYKLPEFLFSNRLPFPPLLNMLLNQISIISKSYEVMLTVEKWNYDRPWVLIDKINPNSIGHTNYKCHGFYTFMTQHEQIPSWTTLFVN